MHLSIMHFECICSLFLSFPFLRYVDSLALHLFVSLQHFLGCNSRVSLPLSVWLRLGTGRAWMDGPKPQRQMSSR
ncbi:hypothetical protein DFP72DRAFT_933392 [Ephemerocybe angulata]|uniref:Secreted protein n=1 Tax=Ephemerocybe angulata TaxID=980116 RepID=A0A8H6LWK4_9AGAR|nr:hypothetical protein DFP72DRAFT_933392 [Tulosesus angulatus]